MATVARRPVVVGVRTLLRILRSEARGVWPDRRTAGLMAEVAARDLISAGRVRLIRGRPFDRLRTGV